MAPAKRPYFERLHQLTLAQANELQPAMDRIMAPIAVGSPTDSDFKIVIRSTRVPPGTKTDRSYGANSKSAGLVEAAKKSW